MNKKAINITALLLGMILCATAGFTKFPQAVEAPVALGIVILFAVTFIPWYKKYAYALNTFLLALYISEILCLTVFGREWFDGVHGEIKVIPFQTIIGYIADMAENPKTFVIQIFGNLFLLAPTAFLLPRISERYEKRKPTYLFFAVSTCLIEISELIFECGTFDVDDLILNFAGGVLFYELFRVLIPKTERQE